MNPQELGAEPLKNTKMTPELLEEFKKKGNQDYQEGSYKDAITAYTEGLHACNAYAEQWGDRLPYKSEYGPPPELPGGQMYYQDFLRLKAVLNNNISMAFMKLRDYDRAHIYNNAAILDDPDYGKAVLRKAQILEETCEYTHALAIANWGMQKLQRSPDTAN